MNIKKVAPIGALVIIALVSSIFFLSKQHPQELSSRKIFIGLNRVFPTTDGSFVIYNGRGFVRLQPDKKFISISPETAAELSQIDVSPDGKSAVAYIDEVKSTDPMISSGIGANEWVVFNFESGATSVLPIGVERAFALNNHAIGVQSFFTSEQDFSIDPAAELSESDAEQPLFLWVFEGDKKSSFGEFNKTLGDMRQSGNNLSLLVGSISSSSLWLADANGAKQIMTLPRRASLSLDGGYISSIGVDNPNQELVTKPAELRVYRVSDQKQVWDLKTTSDLQANWANKSALSLSYPNRGEIVIKSHNIETDDDKTYQIGDENHKQGSVYVFNDGFINSTAAAIYELAEKTGGEDVELIIENEFVLGLYAINILGDSTTVDVYEEGVASLISMLNQRLGENATHTGYRFVY